MQNFQFRIPDDTRRRMESMVARKADEALTTSDVARAALELGLERWESILDGFDATMARETFRQKLHAANAETFRPRRPHGS